MTGHQRLFKKIITVKLIVLYTRALFLENCTCPWKIGLEFRWFENVVFAEKNATCSTILTINLIMLNKKNRESLDFTCRAPSSFSFSFFYLLLLCCTFPGNSFLMFKLKTTKEVKYVMLLLEYTGIRNQVDVFDWFFFAIVSESPFYVTYLAIFFIGLSGKH